jgi:hypothetical protein
MTPQLYKDNCNKNEKKNYLSGQTGRLTVGSKMTWTWHCLTRANQVLWDITCLPYYLE